MHELGLAQGVLDIVRQHVPEAAAGAVRQVRVRVGTMAGVIPDSLVFCFDAITAGTPFALATLTVDHVPPTAHCAACGITFPVRPPASPCPGCGSHRVALVSGRELQVVEVELADADEVPA